MVGVLFFGTLVVARGLFGELFGLVCTLVVASGSFLLQSTWYARLFIQREALIFVSFLVASSLLALVLLV